MKISIVTAVYNREHTIGDTILSIQSQNYQNVEHVIQDGGSTDGTLQIISANESAMAHLVSECDSGIYDAINKGIYRTSGDVIGLMHSDDFFAHEKVLEKVAIEFQDPSVDGVYGDLQYVSAVNTRKVIRHWQSGNYNRRLLRRGWMPPHPTLYLRRRIFEEWGYYDTSFKVSADYEAMLRYLWKANIKLAYVPEVMVKMRVGGESNRSLKLLFQKTREDYKALRRNGVGGFFALFEKNIRKLKQFIIKEQY